MRYPLSVLLLIVSAHYVWGQAENPPSCAKNISFAVAENGQPVPAIPKFTLKWLAGKSRRESFSSLCFSQVPSATQTNYIVVFSTTANAFDGLKASAHTYRSSPQGHDGNVVNSYGGTWSYAYTGAAPPATTSTLELNRDDKPKALNVRAFDQGGRTISQDSLGESSSREKLLEKVLADIIKDSPPPETRKPFASPLSVYYVNCDVDGQPVSPNIEASVKPIAAVAPPVPATPTPPPQPKSELQIWSSPAGADVFLDGAYVGQTPYSQEVSPGQHTIDLRKKNFAIWQRKIQAQAGTRRIGGNLEQKILDLQ
jgi:hypothetical protein